MIIKTEGMILSQRSYRDSEKFLTILTRDQGVLEAKLRQYGQIKRSQFNLIGPLGYFRFDLFVLKQRYTVDAAEKIEDFFPLRYDVEKLALAGYFCELTQSLAPPREEAWVYLRLLLNTLALLEKDRRSPAFLKAVFELRALSIGGFMPDLVCCKHCCQFEGKKLYFLPFAGTLVCSDCLPGSPENDQLHIPLAPPVLAAMRYILYKEADKLFQFSLAEKPLEQLGKIAEYYTLCHMENSKFPSLQLYHQFVNLSTGENHEPAT